MAGARSAGARGHVGSRTWVIPSHETAYRCRVGRVMFGWQVVFKASPLGHDGIRIRGEGSLRREQRPG